MKKCFLFFVCVVAIVLSLAACGEVDSVVSDTETADTIDTEVITDTETETETEPVETQPVLVVPEYTNPLTGLGTTREDLYESRPVAIMINNLRGALPQEGIADADIMYECLVEGGITRLMAVVSDYESLGAIGSIRSCRHYYLDLAKNYDAIYIHAGGSDQGYIEIKNRGVNNLDGVNMYVPNMFYRDQDRLKVMSYEHTLMTDGARIAEGIKFKKYRTELLDEFKNKDAFNFVEFGTRRELSGENAESVVLPYSNYQTARFDYDKLTNSYYRFQFVDAPHIDGTTGKQLSFTNILILFCDVKAVGDAAGHLDITTENQMGEGYYISGGKAEAITWSKLSEDAPTVYYGADGSELSVNRGKTFISIFPEYNRQNIEFNSSLTGTVSENND